MGRSGGSAAPSTGFGAQSGKSHGTDSQHSGGFCASGGASNSDEVAAKFAGGSSRDAVMAASAKLPSLVGGSSVVCCNPRVRKCRPRYRVIKLHIKHRKRK